MVYPKLNFLVGKCRLDSTCQSCWVIFGKELEAAKLCIEIIFVALKNLRHLKCSVYIRTDSQVVPKWINNPDLHLVRFAKPCVHKILGAAPPKAWNYVYTLFNPADVVTR